MKARLPPATVLRRGALTFLAAALITGGALAQDAPALATDKDKLSYALGVDLGSQLRRLGVEIDPAVFATALADGLSGGETLMTPEEARREIGTLQDQVQRREAEKRMPAPGGAGTGGVSPPAGQAAPANAQ